MRACVGIVLCTALLGLFFYFETSANKLVNLIVGLKVTLGELVINAVAWISIPNEPCDLYEKPTICSERGLLLSRSVQAAWRTRASFERSR
jgi:hypothetical protein